MSKLQEKITEIKKNLNTQTSSKQDEIEVMRMMLNDKEYKVGIFDKNGLVEEFCPSDNARGIVSSVLSNAGQLSTQEANELAENYEFNKKEAQNMVTIAKEFVNTYIQTGRKLPLGTREQFESTLSLKEVEEGTKTSQHPSKNEDGSYTMVIKTVGVPKHSVLKISSKCPEHLKK